MKPISVPSFVMVSAVRYAIGRSSYVVGATVDTLIRVWDDLPTKDQHTIHRDIMRAVKDHATGNFPNLDIGAPHWERALTHCTPRDTPREGDPT